MAADNEEARIWLKELILAGMDPLHFASVRLSTKGPLGSSWLNRVGYGDLSASLRDKYWCRYADMEGALLVSPDFDTALEALQWYIEKRDERKRLRDRG